METVFLGTSDVDGGLGNLQILLAVDSMLVVANDVQRTCFLELQMAFAVDTAVIVAVLSVCQRVGGTLLDFNLDALAILDIEGSSRGIGQCQVVELDNTFVVSLYIKLAVRRCSRE